MRARVVQQIAGAIFRLVRSAGMSRATASCPPTVAYRIWRCNLVAGQSWPKNCLGLLPGLCVSEDMPAVDGMGRAGCHSSGLMRSGPRNPLRAAWVRPDAQVCPDQARLLDGLPDPARNLSELRCGTKSGPESVGNPAYEPGRAPDPGRNLSEIRFRTRSGPDSVGNLVRGCFGELAGWA